MKEYKISMIEGNIKARKEEIAGYEINIFNYEYILCKTKDEVTKKQLEEAISSNNVEMNKVKLVLEALEAQLISLGNENVC
jgi:hypothetical protein